MGLAAPHKDAETLRALTVYLSSSLVDFFIFFQVPEWGVYADYPIVVLRAVRTIPTPDFDKNQVVSLANAHREILRLEKDSNEQIFQLESEDATSVVETQRFIDKTVFEALDAPDDVRLLVEDFRDNRLPLDKGTSALNKLGKRATIKELQAYGRTLRNELERFLLGEAQPCVRLLATDDLIRCELELLPAGTHQPHAIEVITADDNPKTRGTMRRLREQLSEQFSQWAYVDRSLRVFRDDAVQIFKSNRLMDWTRTQALNDADAVIAEILADGEKSA
jgi:hypothetical protein